MYIIIPYINNDIVQITIITLLSITGSTSGSSKY